MLFVYCLIFTKIMEAASKPSQADAVAVDEWVELGQFNEYLRTRLANDFERGTEGIRARIREV